MFKKLRQAFREIDSKVAEILGMPVNVDELWSSAWEMMERRVKGAGREVRPGVEVEIKENRENKGLSSHIPLTRWFKPGGG